MNRIRERTTQISITDQGCMLRGYHRNIVEAINRCVEVSTYVPALGYTFARHPGRNRGRARERAGGQSKYSLYRLIRLNFDLMTGFSVAPLQFFTMAGMVIALLSLLGFSGWRFAAWWSARRRKVCSRCSASRSSSSACC